MAELGNCAAYYTIRGFLNKSQDEFLKSLKKNYHKVSDFELEEGQIKAWKDCYNVLHESLSALPASYNNCWIVFEYVLPKHKPGSKKFLDEIHIRADALLISADTVLVLEFKQFKDPFGFKQAKKYQARIEAYHAQSQDMAVYPLLVLTKAVDYVDNVEEVYGCSPDRLAKEIIYLCGDKPNTSLNINCWLDSDFCANKSISSSIEDQVNTESDSQDQVVSQKERLIKLMAQLNAEAERMRRLSINILKPGTMVFHPSFGYGTVTDNIIGSSYDKISVRFEHRDASFIFPNCVIDGFIRLLSLEEKERLSIAKYVEHNYVSPEHEDERERVQYSADYDELLFQQEDGIAALRFDPTKGFFQLDEGFGETVLNLIRAKGMTESQCYNKANISRAAFYKIRQSARDPKNAYRPTKQTAMALAIALELSLEEAENLLERAGYAFSHSNKGDIIVEYFLINKKYDINELNEVLYEYDQPLLGSV